MTLWQTGDPSGTGTGSESIYGEPFKDEFHSRLRFSHRWDPGCWALFSVFCQAHTQNEHLTGSRRPWTELGGFRLPR